jgi:NAD(P)H-hydrate repair Nnr-like enzyme with NAD(P)H-hydrate dehydratase domain
MENINWLRQTPDKPLFPDILWNRPENKRYAGKLLIIGGHSQSFSEPSRAFTAAAKAGAGTVRILLPDALRKTLGKAFPEAEFAASTPIGSFSRQALELFLDLSDWADGVLLAGDFGKNSETAILLESFIDKYAGQLSLTGDSLDYFLQKPAQLINREKTLVIGSLGQIQKLAQAKAVIRQTEDLAQILNKLSIFTSDIKALIITEQSGQIIVADKGRISTTKSNGAGVGPELAAYASVWAMQQPEKTFEALTTAAYCYNQE